MNADIVALLGEGFIETYAPHCRYNYRHNRHTGSFGDRRCAFYCTFG